MLKSFVMSRAHSEDIADFPNEDKNAGQNLGRLANQWFALSQSHGQFVASK